MLIINQVHKSKQGSLCLVRGEFRGVLFCFILLSYAKLDKEELGEKMVQMQ